MFSNSKDDDDSTDIGNFLNQPSPDKKRKAIVLDDDSENDTTSLGNLFDIEHANDSDSDVAIEKVVASENNDENLKDLKSIEVKKEMLKEASDKAKKKQPATKK